MSSTAISNSLSPPKDDLVVSFGPSTLPPSSSKATPPISTSIENYDSNVATNNTSADSAELNITEKLALSDSEHDDDDDDDPIVTNKSNKGNKSKRIIDSSDDDETDDLRTPAAIVTDMDADEPKTNQKTAFKLIDTDSEPDGDEDEINKKATTESDDSSEKKKDKNKNKKDKKRIKKSSSHNLKNICDDDDESSDDSSSSTTDLSASQKPSKKRPPQRMSAREADEQMKMIQSESQRMAREANLSVPYHVPKKHSLKEFLNRRNINKAVPQLKTVKAAAAIKMSKEDLIEYAKKLDERAIESQLFYKSDSDDEGDDGKVDDVVGEEKNADAAETDTQQKLAEIVAIEHCNTSTVVDSLDTNSNEPIDGFDELVQAQCPNAERLLEEIAVEEQLKVTESVTNKVTIDYEFGDEKTTTTTSLKDTLLRSELMLSSSIGTINPTLGGTVNSVIDLDTGDILPGERAGVDDLLERFMKHAAAKKKKGHSQQLSILGSNNGVLEMETVTLTTMDKDADIIPDCKPRSAFFKLKEALSSQLAAKRKEEILRRKADLVDMDKKNRDLEGDDDDDEEEVQDEDEIEDEIVDESTKEKNFIDEEAAEDEASAGAAAVENDDDDDGDEDEDENNDDDEDEEEEEEEDDTTNDGLPKVRKRIVVMNDSDDENVAPTSTELDQSIGALIDSITHGDHQLEPTVPALIESSLSNFDSTKTLFTQTTADDISDTQLLGLCSGAFVTQAPKDIASEPVAESIDVRRALESSSDDDGGDDDDDNNSKDAPKRVKRKTKRLPVLRVDESDEEDKPAVPPIRHPYDENDDDEEDDEEAPPMADAEEEPERFVDYDSEENEVEVVMNKKDRVKKAGEFFEQEADLSGSEYGSADEDERGMDKYDIELGDDDEFDQSKIQSELERIHMRRVLDKDARDIKKIQDLLFEDEEESGIGRERQFKWKNVDNKWADDDQGLVPSVNEDGANGRQSDDENEGEWRKIRHERELLLQETNASSAGGSSGTLVSPIVVDGGGVKRKITIIKSAGNASKLMADSRESPFLIGKSGIDGGGQAKRNSFLQRDAQTLSKLAAFASKGNDGSSTDVDGGVVIPAVAVAAKQRNFLFTTLSPAAAAEKSMTKRKSDENADGAKLVKKAKLASSEMTATAAPNSKRRLLDILT